MTEVRINSSTTSFQNFQKLAKLEDGSFVAVWHSDHESVPGLDVMAQIYDANGNPLGEEFKVNSLDYGTAGFTDDARLPNVAALSDGGFIVSWVGTDSSEHNAYAQIFDANGVPAGSEFQLDENLSNTLNFAPDIEQLANGNIVSTWSDSSTGNQIIRVFDNTGAPITSELPLSVQGYSGEVKALNDGGFVTTWVSGGDVYAQQFDASGESVGGVTLVADSNVRFEGRTSIAVLEDGSYIITWEEEFFGTDTYARRYASDGSEIGETFTVALGNDNNRAYVSNVEARPDGGFVISYARPDGGIFFKIYDSESNVIVDETVAVTSTGRAFNELTVLDDGGFIISYLKSNNQIDIYAQRFDAEGNKIDFAVEPSNSAPIVDGTSGNDRIDENYVDADGDFVTDGDDVVEAGAGNDTVYSGDGNDELYGGEGNDRLYGGNGNNSLYGGEGQDIIHGSRDGDDLAFGGDGRDTLFGFDGDDTLDGGADNDRLVGGNGDDLLRAGSGDDILFGNKGHDHLEGGAGDDDLYAGSGDDFISGGSGEDSLVGNTGNDTLQGDEGDDRMSGGGGDDVYIYSSGDGNDIIVEAGGLRDNDIFQFTDLNTDDLSVAQNGDDLLFTVAETGHVIEVDQQFRDSSKGIEGFIFADGTTLDQDAIQTWIDTGEI